jgi:hypothetical protein
MNRVRAVLLVAAGSSCRRRLRSTAAAAACRAAQALRQAAQAGVGASQQLHEPAAPGGLRGAQVRAHIIRPQQGHALPHCLLPAHACFVTT